jgi:hypothetical protein
MVALLIPLVFCGPELVRKIMNAKIEISDGGAPDYYKRWFKSEKTTKPTPERKGIRW